MDIYTLDALNRREFLIDRHESMIWTERFNKWGDFVLTVNATNEMRAKFRVGTSLMIPNSLRVMVVETVEESEDEEGKKVLEIKGRSLEKILDDRLARGSLSDLTTEPKWVITDQPADIARKLFHDICVTGILDTGDIIPGISETSIFPTDTIAEPPDTITYEIEPQTLYSALSNLCDIFEMGFRLVLNPTTLTRHFDVYMGSDRTSKQTTLPAVVFSPELENLQNTKALTTNAMYKNVAYVISPVGHEIVYPLDIDPLIDGFDRRVLFVKADDITDTVPADATAKMIQRGLDELSKYRQFSAFDGELNDTQSRYKYGVHYHLGDLVEIRNASGVASDMQVTEQIFVSDREGERSYPTLSVNKYITPGSWLSWDANEVWNDVDPDLEWDELP
jgi:hypothetical protein